MMETKKSNGKKKLTRRRKINLNAQRLVSVATQQGHSYEDIANICDVSVGSVKRWVATGRADSDAIRPLEEKIGHLYLKPEAVADVIVEIYKNRRKRFRLTRPHLKRISGRTVFKGRFLESLEDCLLVRNYHFIEESDGEEDFFIIVKSSKLRRLVPETLELSEIKQYFQGVSESIQDDEDD